MIVAEERAPVSRDKARRGIAKAWQDGYKEGLHVGEKVGRAEAAAEFERERAQLEAMRQRASNPNRNPTF